LTRESLFFFLKPPICRRFWTVRHRQMDFPCIPSPAGWDSTPAAVFSTCTNNF
jgi:hypothetical protein